MSTNQSTAIILTDAVISTLNTSVLSLPFTAERWYVPVRDIKELIDLTISVVPVSIEGELLSRAAKYMEQYGISIGVQKIVGQGAMTNEQILESTDPLMRLVEEIVDLLVPEIIIDDPIWRARVIGYKNEPIFSPQNLENMRVFTSVITLVLKVGK